MSFKLHTRGAQGDAPIEYLACDDITVHIGDALYYSSGHLIKCTGSNKPAFICVQEKVVGTDGDPIGVVRITDDQTWKTQLSANSSDIAKGVAYTISATADGITATAEAAAAGQTPAVLAYAEVQSWEGKSAGDNVIVRFR